MGFGKTYFRKMTNKELLYFHNKMEREREHKKEYGTYGTGRYVSQNEFWGRENREHMREEIKRRQKAGLIRKSAGKRRTSRRAQPMGFMMFRPIRF